MPRFGPMDYYLAASTAGYTFEASYAWVQWKGMQLPFVQQTIAGMQAWGANKAAAADTPGWMAKALPHLPVLRQREEPGRIDHRTRGFKDVLNLVEAATFLGITTWMHHREKQQMLADCREAVALETGKAPDQVTSGDVRHSSNPLIALQEKQLRHKNRLRLITDLTFAYNLVGGIVSKLANYAVETTTLRRPLAYSQMVGALEQSQTAALGLLGRDTLVERLAEAVQQTRAEAGLPAHPEAALQACLPVLREAAAHFCQNRLKTGHMLHLVGVAATDSAEQLRSEWLRVQRLAVTTPDRAR